MSANEGLPVILVSAVDAAAASVIISEIIDDGSPAVRCNGVEHGDPAGGVVWEHGDPAGGVVWEHGDPAGGVVWELRNKYYTAAARLLPLPDGAAPPPGLDVQAHVIYLTEDECSDAAACARRSSAAAAGGSCVRLVAARAAHEPPALVQWASARRYELVALQAAPEPAEAEAGGAARVREALHAHAWPGLRLRRAPRTPAPAPAPAPAPEPGDDRDSDSSESSWGSWVGADSADPDPARATQFAEALALLPAARPARGAGPRVDPRDDAARRLHAEQLVAVFCRALGHDLRRDTP